MHSGFIPDMNVENGGVNSGIFFFFATAVSNVQSICCVSVHVGAHAAGLRGSLPDLRPGREESETV